MAKAIVAEKSPAPRIVGAVAPHAVCNSIAIDRARTNDRPGDVGRRIVRTRAGVVRTGAVVRTVAIVGSGEHPADDRAGDKSRSNAPAPTAAPLHGFHIGGRGVLDR